jgi:hypothetical protein
MRKGLLAALCARLNQFYNGDAYRRPKIPCPLILETDLRREIFTAKALPPGELQRLAAIGWLALDT